MGVSFFYSYGIIYFFGGFMKQEKSFLQSLMALLVAVVTIGIFRGLGGGGGWND